MYLIYTVDDMLKCFVNTGSFKYKVLIYVLTMCHRTKNSVLLRYNFIMRHN